MSQLALLAELLCTRKYLHTEHTLATTVATAAKSSATSSRLLFPKLFLSSYRLPKNLKIHITTHVRNNVYTACHFCYNSNGLVYCCMALIVCPSSYNYVYMRVLTLVQFSSNSTMDVGCVNPGYNSGWGRSHWRLIRVESGLKPSCERS